MPSIDTHFLDLAMDLNCNVFIESGTFRGESFLKAIESGYFERVYTVEIDRELYKSVANFFPKSKRYQVFWGRSQEVFVLDIFPLCKPDDRIYFFLDGHYSAGNTGGASELCPLLPEIEAIRKACPTQAIVIVIDDTDDLGRRDDNIPGFSWPSREEVEQALLGFDIDFHILDYTGKDPQWTKAYRGILIYSYSTPSDAWQLTHIEATFAGSNRKLIKKFRHSTIQLKSSRAAKLIRIQFGKLLSYLINK